MRTVPALCGCWQLSLFGLIRLLLQQRMASFDEAEDCVAGSKSVLLWVLSVLHVAVCVRVCSLCAYYSKRAAAPHCVHTFTGNACTCWQTIVLQQACTAAAPAGCTSCHFPCTARFCNPNARAHMLPALHTTDVLVWLLAVV
jgi:hypothetical protein